VFLRKKELMFLFFASLSVCWLQVVSVSRWKMLRTADDFRLFVEQQAHATDKTSGHSYESMYWNALNRVMAHTDLPPRIFEIGLGCFMQFGTGGSAKLWRTLFPYASLHIFEYQRKCGEEWERANPGVAVLHYGDQSSASDLNAATIADTFDLIVDDGSHMSSHQLISLVTLWPKVTRGGVYVVEDVHSSCCNWDVPGQSYKTAGRVDCMQNDQGAETFFAHVVRHWLPVLVRNRDESPHDLPELESITFYHEAIMFTKRP
jgi:hypothetical protein